MSVENKPNRIGRLLVAVSFISMMVGAAGTGVFDHFDNHSGAAQAAAPDSRTVSAPQALPDFASLAKRLGPAVVNISTTQVRKTAQDAPNPFGNDDSMNQFWERFFGGRMPRGGQQRQTGLGSGFIVDRDGTILTNYHVVDAAQKIVVTLSDGRTLEGKVLGKDEKTDIAVVKVDARDLPTAPLGDSDRLEVGEWVDRKSTRLNSSHSH